MKLLNLLLCAAALLFVTVTGVSQADESPPDAASQTIVSDVEKPTLNEVIPVNHGELVAESGGVAILADSIALAETATTFKSGTYEQRLRIREGDSSGGVTQPVSLIDTPPPPNAKCACTPGEACDCQNCRCHDPTARPAAILQRKTFAPRP